MLLVWLGHVTVTGAELAISGASWSFEAELMDPSAVASTKASRRSAGRSAFQWAPWLYTSLVLSWMGGAGWLVIAAIIVVATIGMGPSVRMAQGFRDTHFPVADEDDAGGTTDTDADLAPEPA